MVSELLVNAISVSHISVAGSQESDLYKLEMPGTNIHSYEKYVHTLSNALPLFYIHI